jgi:hypothetical protein
MFYVEGLRIAAKILNWYSNWELSEYKSEALLLR